MAKIHTLTYNGTKSSDLGVFVSGSGSFDAAEFDVDKYEIPGRNGDLILSNNRYKNIEITYPAFIPKAFMDKVQNVRNWLRTSKVYARLEDTYDMDHYRLGIPTGVQSFSPENRNDGANFEMTFDCKPQRFLKVGETPETVEADVQTETGEIVTFETVAESPITSASVSLSPIQSLNGYDSPWPGGGGKNKLAPWITSQTLNAVTWTANADGSATASGTASGSSQPFSPNITLPAGTYVISGCPSGGSSSTYFIRVLAYNSGGTLVNNWSDYGSGATFTIDSTIDHIRVFASVNNGTTAPSGTWYPMIRLSSVSDSSWTPYSNICPISGHTGAELIRTGKNLLPHKFYQFNSSQLSVGTDTSTTYAHYLKAGTYTLSASLMGQARWIIREEHDTANTNVGGTLISANPHGTFTIDKDGMYRIWLYGSGITAEMVSWFQLELGSSATAYEPYDGDTYSVTFTDQGTVYGGTYDFVTGKLTVTHRLVELDTAWFWYKSGNQPVGASVISTTQFPEHVYNPADECRCSHFKKTTTVYIVNMTAGEFLLSANGVSAYFCMPTADYTAADFRDYITAQKNAGTPITVYYELATPLEYTLSPQQLTTLFGQNVVWGNGTITLTYAEPYNIDNPTLFDARPLFTVTNPAEGDVIMVNGQTITFVDGYTGTVLIDCETMNAYSGAANLNSIIQATDFPVLVPGTNVVTWTGAGECTMTPRWWEL